jgi:glycosyltransferase involved in cell wall biosynthesis
LKTKVLFVVGGLHRAGAERFAFEIDANINKKLFQIDILCTENKADIPLVFGERYYDSKHRQLGTSINYFDDFNKTKSLAIRIKNKLSRVCGIKEVNFLESFLSQFDIIHFMGEYTYFHQLSSKIESKSLISIMSAKFQNDNLYSSFDKQISYNFTSGFNPEEVLFELKQFNVYNHKYLPLITSFPKNQGWTFNGSNRKIGIFTRVNSYKPLEIFYHSFHILLNKIEDCELHIFGAFDLDMNLHYRMLDSLKIRNKVFFRGHQDDIRLTAVTEELALSWFQGYNSDRPAGYAGIDICSVGLPLVCWDFHPNPSKNKNEIYPHFTSILNFVEFSAKVILNEDTAVQLSRVQMTETIHRFNIASHIPTLEKFYLDIIENNKEK